VRPALPDGVRLVLAFPPGSRPHRSLVRVSFLTL